MMTAADIGKLQVSAVAGSPADQVRLRRAAEAFTAVALDELLKPIFETTDTANGFFGGGAGEQAFRPMLVTEIARQIARQGGLGLAQPILQQMLRLQET